MILACKRLSDVIITTITMAITIIIRAIQDVRASKVNDNYTHIRKYVMKGKTYGINQV